MAEHLSLEQKVVGLSPVWSRVGVVVVIRRFRVRIPGGIVLCPVGPMVRRLTTEVLPIHLFFISKSLTREILPTQLFLSPSKSLGNG